MTNIERLNLIMMGPPGSGKGTQADRLARARGIPKISTGDILREAVQARTGLGLRAKAIMDRGELVSDDIMVGIVSERLQQPDAAAGFILDGFPRTVAQASALDQILEGRGPLIIVDLVVPNAELTRRMQARRVCRACGANAEPSTATEDAAPERCRRCGGELITRSDDGDAAVRLRRLEVYARESKPLLDYYRTRSTFRSVNGAQSFDQVSADLVSALDSALGVATVVGQAERSPHRAEQEL